MPTNLIPSSRRTVNLLKINFQTQHSCSEARQTEKSSATRSNARLVENLQEDRVILYVLGMIC